MGDDLNRVQRQQIRNIGEHKDLYQVCNHNILYFEGEILLRISLFLPTYFHVAGGESESATPEIKDPSESGRKAQTWFFRPFVRLKDGQTFLNLLDLRKQQLETSLASASVISWACADTNPPETQLRAKIRIA